MEFNIVWTDRALKELRDLCSYISNDNPAAAERIGDEIIRHVDVLSAFPLIGPPYPRGGSVRVREILCGSYRIFYRVSDERKLVEILTIWHAARGTPPFDD
jgi:toxin ParE1/3/4